MERQQAKERSLELLEVVGLSEVARKKIRTFSGGMKQRLGMLNHFLVTDSQMEMGINPIYEGQDNLADFAYETMGGLAGRGIPGSVSHPGGDRVLEPGAQRAGDPLHPGLCQRVQRHPVPGLLAQPDDGGLCLS